MTLNMRAQPGSCTHTPRTPERPARSISSQIMPAFMTHLEYEKSEGGSIGQARPRIVAAADQHRAGLALLEILLADLAPVLAGRDPQPDLVRAVHHRAVGAAVHPVLLRVAHDHQVVGADVAPAVVLVQERRGEFQDVYTTAFQYVFQDRPVVYYARRNGLVHLHPVAIGAHHVDRMRRHREAEW